MISKKIAKISLIACLSVLCLSGIGMMLCMLLSKPIPNYIRYVFYIANALAFLTIILMPKEKKFKFKDWIIVWVLLGLMFLASLITMMALLF